MGRGRRLDAHCARVYLMFHLACEVAKRAATCKSGRKRPLCKFGFAARSSVSERVFGVFKDAPNKRTLSGTVANLFSERGDFFIPAGGVFSREDVV